MNEIEAELTRVQANVMMIDASPAGSLNATLKRRALDIISAALGKAKEIEGCIPIEDAPEVIEPPHRY